MLVIIKIIALFAALTVAEIILLFTHNRITDHEQKN
jgi:hypothetical protein